MTAAISDEPRYALALYDGARLMGFMPQKGESMVRKPDGDGIDLFYSKTVARSQARLLAIKFAPLTVSPFDLVANCPLDPIVGAEEDPMPLKDEETREPAIRNGAGTGSTGRIVLDGSTASIRVAEGGGDDVMPRVRVNPADGLHEKAERAELVASARTLIAAHYLLANLLDRLNSKSEV